MTTKIDHKKTLGKLYKAGKKPEIIEVPDMNYLMLDGAGTPGNQAYVDAVGALYSLAYPIRFAIKDRQDIAYTVLPLQGLWWVEDMSLFSADKKEDWLWRMMIMQPDLVTTELVEEMRAVVRDKKNPPCLDNIRFESYSEGTVVQILHIGPYADEEPNIRWIHQVAKEQGYKLVGKHHEIYLSNPQRVAPEKLKTIIRQPIAKA